jgi:methylphosphotriester-DNA--protein-cysteine methyltransferase
VTLFRTEVSEELTASIIRAKRINELGSDLAVTNKLVAANIVPMGVKSQKKIRSSCNRYLHSNAKNKIRHGNIYLQFDASLMGKLDVARDC